MRNHIQKLICALLMAALFLAATASAALPERAVPFSQMEYAPMDPQNIAAQIDRLTERLESVKSPSAAGALVIQVEKLCKRFDTMYTLSCIHYDMDNRDDYWYEEYTKNSVGYAAVDTARTDFYAALEGGESALNGVDAAEYMPLYEEESRLIMEYRRILGSGTVTYRGMEYSLSSMTVLDYDAYYEVMDRWLDKYNLPLAEIYAELISVRRQLAEIWGYDNYFDMALENIGYGYDAAMVEKLLDDIAREAVPIYEELIDVGMYYMPYVKVKFEDYAAALPKILNRLDGSFTSVWNFMLENELIYTEARDYSSPGAYSIFLAEYEEPFIFCPYYDDADSMTAVLHEFGHAYSDTMGVILDLDTAEVFSQTMQLLAANHYDVIFPQEDYELRYDVAADIFSSYMVCTDTLFELRAYELENPTPETLNALYAECDEVFKYYSIDMPYEIYSRIWVVVAQLFETPGYMIAYSVSADAALQLWEISLRDERRAVQLYMDLIRNAERMSLPESLKSLGLKSAFDSGRARETADFCRKVLLDEVLDEGGGTPSWLDMLKGIVA